jgi:asparagine synthetase B (glutamine-hydrolysing)
VLREAVRPLLPTFALERPKQPFSTPIRGWFAGELRAPIRDVLLSNTLIRELFHADALERTLNNHFSGREKQEEIVFRLLNLALWAERFGVQYAAAQ